MRSACWSTTANASCFIFAISGAGAATAAEPSSVARSPAARRLFTRIAASDRIGGLADRAGRHVRRIFDLEELEVGRLRRRVIFVGLQRGAIFPHFRDVE